MITNEQIAAGAAVLCDCGKPIGRNAAISVFDAMTQQAAPEAPTTTASASRAIPAQEFLLWNRRQAKPPVEITKEMYVFRKALEFTSPAPSREADVLLRDLADAADIFMKGGVAGVRQAIDNAHAYLARRAAVSTTGDAVAVLQSLKNPYNEREHGAIWYASAHAWDMGLADAIRALRAAAPQLCPASGPLSPTEEA